MASWISNIAGAISKGKEALSSGREKVFGKSTPGAKDSSAPATPPPSIIGGGQSGWASPKEATKWGQGA